ncbi:MAG: hypothetical protein GY694_19320, partial [Gammaproteobacteria bacterium]|nr:hypothetical protein [Gammaproteobacteria bacterium]
VDWVERWKTEPSWTKQKRIAQKDKPVLFACLEHQAWIKNITRYLDNEIQSPPTIQHNQCHFNQWLETHGRKNYASEALLQKIEVLHVQVHKLAIHLIKLHTKGEHTKVSSQLDELYHLRDTLVQYMNKLLQLSS